MYRSVSCEISSKSKNSLHTSSLPSQALDGCPTSSGHVQRPRALTFPFTFLPLPSPDPSFHRSFRRNRPRIRAPFIPARMASLSVSRSSPTILALDVVRPHSPSVNLSHSTSRYVPASEKSGTPQRNSCSPHAYMSCVCASIHPRI